MKKILIYQLLLLCSVCFLVWYFVFPHYLWFLEGNSFFSTIPDFVGIQLSLPADWAEYAGAYLLQFYSYRVIGAIMQVLFVVVILLTSDWIVFRLFRNKGLLWLSFIPVACFISGQFDDTTLVRSMWWVADSALLALIVWAITIKRKMEPKGLRKFFCSPFFTYIIPCLLLAPVIYSMATKEMNRVAERTHYLDYLTERRKWDTLLQEISPEDARRSLTDQQRALLALSEQGVLPDRVFEYGIADPSNFYYERQDYAFCRNFNSQFFLALGFDNEVIHHSFQAGIHAPYGMNFRTMRTVIDAWLRLGNYSLAEKWLNVMQHTTCHGTWTKQRMDYLQLARSAKRKGSEKNEPFFIGAHPFLSEMARVLDADPNDRKALDYLLCGLLVKRDLGKFYQVFDRFYTSPVSLPRYYEEALLLLATQHPEVIQKHPVSAKKGEEFKEFYTLMNGGQLNQQLLEMKYRDSFWFHYYATKG